MSVNGRTRVLGLLGDPVEHTMSPQIHNGLSELLELNNIYVPFHTRKEGLKSAIEGAFALNVLGLNVTVPHKNSVMEYIVDIDEGAEAIGAVNTLVRVENGFKGYNTDMLGLSRELDSYAISLAGRQVIILGAGGAAKAVSYMCMRNGAERIYILNRTLDKAKQIATHMNRVFSRDTMIPMELSAYQNLPQERYIVFQSTSIGLAPNEQDVVIPDKNFYSLVETGIDLIYNPFETQFMKLCKEAGANVYNGLKMLLYQGIIAYELWNDIEVSEDIADAIYQMLLKETRKNILLIGFMGSGKTTVGQALEENFGYRLLDTDSYIEKKAGSSISDIFETKGEQAFRDLETDALKELQQTVSHTVISTGGGMPLREENAMILSKIGKVVYLNVEPDEVIKRIGDDTSRPLLQSEDREAKVRELLDYRNPIYRKYADVIVNVSGRKVEDIVQEIMRK